MDEFYYDYLNPFRYSIKKKDDDKKSFWRKTDNGYMTAYKMAGISENDAVVKFDDNKIKIVGDSNYKGYKYHTEIEIGIEDIKDEIENIKYEIRDGVIYIYVNTFSKKAIVPERII